MKAVDYLVIGGSAAGTTAAETIRNLKPSATIAIVTDENQTQYSRVLLPHYIRGKVTREQVFLKNEVWYQQKRIELVRGFRVQGLVVSKKAVRLSNGQEISYGKLLVSIGGFVIPLVVPGVDGANICYMRTVDDADRIIVEAKKAKKAVIVGGGFIGLEYCSCFRLNGVEDVTLLVMEPYFWSFKLDSESAGAIVDVLAKNGVKIVTNEEVDHIEQKGPSLSQIVTKAGNTYEADVIGVGIGIRSSLKWLEGTGININRAIVTNEFLETNLKDIYAAGDCAEFRDVLFERQHIVGNWANATSQGSVVGKTMAGTKTVFQTASSYSISFFNPPNSGACTFIGVTEEDFADQIIARGSQTEGKVTRIFVKKYGDITRIVGATVVNNPADVAPLMMAIKNKVDVSSKVAELEKAELKTLTSGYTPGVSPG